jgi:hypothetical protein
MRNDGEKLHLHKQKFLEREKEKDEVEFRKRLL